MKYNIDDLLDDIINSIDKVKKYVLNMDYNAYLENDLIQDGVERRYERIAENMKRIRDNFPDTFNKITNGNEVIGARNIIINNYENINTSVLFKASGNDLDNLKDEIITLKNEQVLNQESTDLVQRNQLDKAPHKKRRGIKR